MTGRQRWGRNRTLRAVGLTVALLAITVFGSEAADNVFLAASAAHARAAASAAARAASRAAVETAKASEIGHERAAAGEVARRAAGIEAATRALPRGGEAIVEPSRAMTREQQPIEDPDAFGGGIRFHHRHHRHPYGRA